MGSSSSKHDEICLWGVYIEGCHPTNDKNETDRMKNSTKFNDPVEYVKFIKKNIGLFPDGSYRRIFYMYEFFEDDGELYGKLTFTNKFDNHPIKILKANDKEH